MAEVSASRAAATPFDIESSTEQEIVLSVLRQFAPRTTTAIFALYVPQFSRNDSVAISLNHEVEPEAPENIEVATSALSEVSLSSRADQSLVRRRVNDRSLITCLLNQTYGIAIGAVSVLSHSEVPDHEIVALCSFLESIVRMKKRSLALGLIEQLSSSLQKSNKLDFDHIGRTVYECVCPAEVVILSREDEKTPNFTTIYSNSGSKLALPASNSVAGWAAREQEAVVVDDIENAGAIKAAFGLDLFNREFSTLRGYKSMLVCPVPANRPALVVILCFFARTSAIASVEIEILRTLCTIVSQHIGLLYQHEESGRHEEEAARLLNISRHAILMAEIIHDAGDDLRAARDNLAIVESPDALQRKALNSARETVGELINISGQFREIFRTLGGDGSTEKRRYDRKSFRPVNLYRLIADLARKYSTELTSKKISLRLLFLPNVVIGGAPYPMIRAIENIIKNSIYYLSLSTHRYRQIDVRYERRAGKHLIRIIDNGLGAEKKDLGRLTTAFYSGRGGMGLGLTIAETAIQAHGGEIQFASEHGRFFEVRIILPVVE